MPTRSDSVKQALAGDSPPKLKSIGGYPILAVDTMAEYINILVYGESGVGKTVLSGSASAVEAMSPVLFLDVEGGNLSLRAFYPEVQVVPVKDWRKMVKIMTDLANGKSGYKTVVIDSLTECAKLAMEFVLLNQVDFQASKMKEMPEIQDWGKSAESMRRFVRNMRDMEMNVIFTALAQQEKDNRGKWQSFPAMPGKLAKELPGYMDIVSYYYSATKKVEGVPVQERRLLSAKTDTIIAKDRSNSLPPVMVEPTMAEIYKHIIGNNN